MTACVNNEKEIKGGVSGKVLRTVAAGVLAMSMMPAAALAVEPADAAALAATQAQDELQTWQAGTFTWNVEADKYKNYKVTEGDVFALESVTDVFGNEVAANDYVVYYFNDGGNAQLDNADTVVAAEDSITSVKGGMPKAYKSAGGNGYIAVVLKTPLPTDFAISKATDWEDVLEAFTNATPAMTAVYKAQDFELTEEAKTLEGAYPYVTGDIEDTTFKFNGGAQTVSFADAEGNELTEGDEYGVTWINGDPTAASEIAHAGTYTAILTGKGAYAGTEATVDVVVEAIDLSKDVVSIDVKTMNDEAGTATNDGFTFDDGILDQTTTTPTKVKVNGDEIAGGILAATLVSATNENGVDVTDSCKNSTRDDYATSFKLAVTKDPNGNLKSSDVVGGAKVIEAYLVKSPVTFKYANGAMFADNTVFNTSKGQKFDRSLIEATVNGNDVDFACTVTKDGVEADTYDAPGEYVLTLEVEPPANLAYAANETIKFKVVANEIGATTVYAAVDGKAVDKAVEYDGEAVVPTVVVKEGSKVLSADSYEVKYYSGTAVDEDKLVESMVEPGKYTVAIDYMGAVDKGQTTVKDPDTFALTIDKATIESAEADTAVYPYTGETVSPTFTGYTDKDLEGTAVTLDPKVTGVRYYTAKVETDGTWTKVSELAASNLKAEGKYIAEISVSSTDPHYQGTGVQATFEISKEAGFTDVASTDWFSESVYKAKALGYINGIQGTTLFAPNADIERSQIAAIMFNMAGGEAVEDGTSNDSKEYPTKFSDVDQAAWYAQAISWASTYGVVNGYAGTDLFGTFDKATREQVAAMFYNYAKAMGQDVTVADEDAALAGISDADTISPWFKTAVAWAVENGVMGNGGSVNAQANITRAEVAAMAVNFQPEAL